MKEKNKYWTIFYCEDSSEISAGRRGTPVLTPPENRRNTLIHQSFNKFCMEESMNINFNKICFSAEQFLNMELYPFSVQHKLDFFYKPNFITNNF